MGRQQKTEINDQIITKKVGNSKPDATKSNLKAYFQQSNGYDIYAYLLEKVYAYKVGLYSSIKQGNVYECIYNFLGGDYNVYWILEDRYDIIWKFFINNLNKNPPENDQPKKAKTLDKNPLKNEPKPKKNPQVTEYMSNDLFESKKIISVSTNISDLDQNDGADILSYIVLDVKELSNDSKEKWVKFQKIDDNTKYLEKCVTEKWAENYSHHFNNEPQSGKGHFWISLKKILQKFKVLALNRFRYLPLKNSENKGESFINLSLDGNHSCALLHFEVEKDEDKLTIGFHQKHKQYLKNILPNYKYSNLRIQLIKQNTEQINKDIIEEKFFENLKNDEFGYVLDFEAFHDQNDNLLADNFMKVKVTKGKFIIACEIFWEEDNDYKNLAQSIQSQNGDCINMKVISLGPNFDIVIYKAILNFYFIKFHQDISQQDPLKKKYDIKYLSINDKINKAVNQKQIDNFIPFQYFEITNGFYVLYGGIEQKDSCELDLITNKKFIKKYYVRAPELISLLTNEDQTSFDIKFNQKRSLMFLLIRTNLSSKNFSKVSTKIVDYFSSVNFSAALKENPGSHGTQEKVDNHYEVLYLEKFFQINSLAEISLHYSSLINRSDEEIYTAIIKKYIQNIKQDIFNSREPQSGVLDNNLNKIKEREPNTSKLIKNLCYQYNQNKDFAASEHWDIINNADSESLSFMEINDEYLKEVIKIYGKSKMKTWNGSSVNILEYVFQAGNFLAYFFENKEKELVYHEVKEFYLEDLKIHGYENGDEFKIDLKPGENLLLIARANPSVGNYNYQCKTKYKIENFC